MGRHMGEQESADLALVTAGRPVTFWVESLGVV